MNPLQRAVASIVGALLVLAGALAECPRAGLVVLGLVLLGVVNVSTIEGLWRRD